MLTLGGYLHRLMACDPMSVMLKSLYALAFLLIVGGLVFQFAALEAFNLLVHKDQGSELAAKDVAYGNDPRQKLDVYKPVSGVGPWPVIVFVHGGSWQGGNKNPYEFVGRALAAQGFVTLVINYRLHPDNKYPAFVEDTAVALLWAAVHAADYGGTGDKLFAMGHSAGAYNIAQAVLATEFSASRPKLLGIVSLAGPFDFLPLDSAITKEVFGHLPNLPDTQPVNHARRDSPPFLILHGSADKTVFPRNSKALDAALRKAGASSTLKIYDGISHVDIILALSTWKRGTAPVLADAVAFMRDKLK